MSKPQSRTLDLDALGRQLKMSESGQARTKETRNRIIEVAEGLLQEKLLFALPLAPLPN